MPTHADGIPKAGGEPYAVAAVNLEVAVNWSPSWTDLSASSVLSTSALNPSNNSGISDRAKRSAV